MNTYCYIHTTTTSEFKDRRTSWPMQRTYKISPLIQSETGRWGEDLTVTNSKCISRIIYAAPMLQIRKDRQMHFKLRKAL